MQATYLDSRNRRRRRLFPSHRRILKLTRRTTSGLPHRRPCWAKRPLRLSLRLRNLPSSPRPSRPFRLHNSLSRFRPSRPAQQQASSPVPVSATAPSVSPSLPSATSPFPPPPLLPAHPPRHPPRLPTRSQFARKRQEVERSRRLYRSSSRSTTRLFRLGRPCRASWTRLCASSVGGWRWWARVWSECSKVESISESISRADPRPVLGAQKVQARRSLLSHRRGESRTLLLFPLEYLSFRTSWLCNCRRSYRFSRERLEDVRRYRYKDSIHCLDKGVRRMRGQRRRRGGKDETHESSPTSSSTPSQPILESRSALEPVRRCGDSLSQRSQSHKTQTRAIPLNAP